MQNTNYRFPTIIEQVSTHEDDSSWLLEENVERIDAFTTTANRMTTIAINDKRYASNHAKQIWCTNFGFTNITNVTGIELRLVTQRLARIQDYVISLLYNGEIIGDNKAMEHAENFQVYGDSNDLWDTVLTDAQVMDPSFGVVVELGPNKRIPHSDIGYIESIEMKVYYSPLPVEVWKWVTKDENEAMVEYTVGSALIRVYFTKERVNPSNKWDIYMIVQGTLVDYVLMDELLVSVINQFVDEYVPYVMTFYTQDVDIMGVMDYFAQNLENWVVSFKEDKIYLESPK